MPIDRDNLLARIDRCVSEAGKDDAQVMVIWAIKSLISVMPEVDAVPVVRCKDCKHSDDTVLCPIAHFLCYCNALNVYERNIYAPDDFFCACGERKNDVKTD